MFKKPHEVTEGALVREALRHKDTTITITDRIGRRWILCNDTAAECKLSLEGLVITETADKQDIMVDFWVRATNGRVG